MAAAAPSRGRRNKGGGLGAVGEGRRGRGAGWGEADTRAGPARAARRGSHHPTDLAPEASTRLPSRRRLRRRLTDDPGPRPAPGSSRPLPLSHPLPLAARTRGPAAPFPLRPRACTRPQARPGKEASRGHACACAARRPASPDQLSPTLTCHSLLSLLQSTCAFPEYSRGPIPPFRATLQHLRAFLCQRLFSGHRVMQYDDLPS
ncbi:uncharacterized protein LOC103690558 [Rattus norvegicus]|uniref:uncharacterized protein LOC103690558 n=1 Tax=Rattus norvegicus TaxID=10116 RepID=UPI002FD847F2